MLRFLTSLLLLFLFPMVATPASQNSTWREGSLSSARKRSNGKRTILLQIHAHWCSPCNQLQQEVLSGPTGAGLLQKAVGVLVNFDAPSGREVTRRYRVLGLPTTLVLTSSGDEIGRVQGYPGRRLWLSAVKDLLQGKQGYSALVARAKREPRSPKWRARLAQALLFRGKTKQAKALFAELMKRGDRWGHFAYRSWGRYLLRVQQNAKEGTEHFLRAYRRFRKTRYATGYLYWAAKGYQRQKKPTKAAALFRPLLRSPRGWALWADFQDHHRYPAASVMKSIRKASLAQKRSSWLWYLTAKTYLRMGKPKKARASIEIALKRNPRMAIYRVFHRKLVR